MLSFNISSFQEFRHINWLSAIHTSVLAFFPHSHLHDTISCGCETILFYTFCIVLILPFVLIITFECFVALIFALFQLSGKLYANLIYGTLLFKKSIYDIDQLIKNLFNHRLPEFILLDLRQVCEQNTIRIDSSGMVKACPFTCFTIHHALHQIRQDATYSLWRLVGISCGTEIKLAEFFYALFIFYA